MNEIFYRCITVLSKMFGPWIFIIGSRIVAAGFFFLFPHRVRNSVRFYRLLFPKRSGCFHLLCAWRQFQNFTTVHLDRFFLLNNGGISYIAEGWEHIEAVVKRKTGGVLLMSHMGNWEIAAHLLKRNLPEADFLLYMGIKHKEQIERLQKDSLLTSGVKIIGVGEDGGSPFDIIEGIGFLKKGGLVSLTGDIVWKGDQRVASVEFLNRTVRLPEAPHLIAMLSGAPILTFFAFRVGKKKYRFTITEPTYVIARSRSERKKTIKRSAQAYADLLREMVCRHPLEWYHFEPFIRDRYDEKTKNN